MTKTAPGDQGVPIGAELTVRVGAVAHGGHCVARHDGQVVFVRHTLPGELVRARVTSTGGSFLRADAVEVLEPAEGRVEAPCPFTGPGRCGGCDFQHADLPTQRLLKADVVTEQLSRLAGIEWDVTVEPLGAVGPPGDGPAGDAPGAAGDGLGWRRRIRFAVAPDGRAGLHRHRSHELEPVDRCLIGAPGVGDSDVLRRTWPGAEAVEVAVDDEDSTAVLRIGRQAEPSRRTPRGRGPARRDGRRRVSPPELVDGPPVLSYDVFGTDYRVAAAGFWQTHPAAAATFVDVVTDAVRARRGERVLDLYCGAGLFTAQFAKAVGETGRVVGIEGDRAATADARANCPDWVDVTQAPVTAGSVRAAADALGRVDVVLLDPPRTGAGRDVMTAVCRAAGRMVVYVACDPAALARDLATASGAGWQLSGLRAFDAFPMTHHVECIAVLTPVS